MKISDIIKMLGEEGIAVTLEKKMSIPTFVEGYKKCYLQGGGTDGRYGYYIINEGGNTGAEKSRMYKIDLEKWEIVAQAQDFLWGHANDVTYDTQRGLVVVSHCNKDISLVDPDTLEVVEVKRLSTSGQYSIAYNKKRNKYAIGKSLCYDIGILDSNFELLTTYAGEDGFVKQGMECDDEFIYFFHTGKKFNWIWVYDWDGNYQGKLRVPMAGESENLYIRGDKFIGAFNNFKDQTADIYEMTLSPKAAEDIPTASTVKIVPALEKKMTIPLSTDTIERCSLIGGGFDGRFAYYLRRQKGGERGSIVKVDTESWEVVSVSLEFESGHVNDMTYDTERGLLALTDGSKDVKLIDPNTLELKDTVTLEIGVIQYAIGYSPEKKQYAVGNRGYDFDVFDGELKHIVRHRGQDGHDRQGMACDGEYVYFLQSSVRNNWVWMYDWDGKMVAKFPIPKHGIATGVFVMDGKLIVSFNKEAELEAEIYEISLSKDI